MLLYISAGATTSHKVAGKDKGTPGLNLLETVRCSLTWFDREALPWHDITWSGIFGSFWFILCLFWLFLLLLCCKKKKKRINAWTCYVCGKGRYAWLWCLWQADDYFPLEIIAHGNVFWGFRGMRNVCFLVLCLFIHHLSIPAHTLIHKHILVHIQAEPRAWSAGPPKGNRW